MPDKRWLKNLAQARLIDGVWLLNDPEESKYQAKGELADFMTILFHSMEEAVQVFNLYRQKGPELRVLPLKKGGHNSIVGVVLLLGKVQIKLEQEGVKLLRTPSEVRDFLKHDHPPVQYLPNFDHFGGLSWKTPSESIITKDHLTRSLLSEICKLHYSASGRKEN